MRRRAVSALSAACAAVLLMSPSPAYAAWPLGSGRVLTPFETPYTAGDTYIHRGIDIAASAGDTVRAPRAGTVSFAGEVPAGAGATRRAVSVTLDDGRIMTFLPLEEVAVDVGSAVDTGDRLGTVAPSGDASSRSMHLHVGLREGRAYRDPLMLLTPPAAVSAPTVGGALAERATVPDPPAIDPPALDAPRIVRAAQELIPVRDAPVEPSIAPEAVREAAPAEPLDHGRSSSLDRETLDARTMRLGGYAPVVPDADIAAREPFISGLGARISSWGDRLDARVPAAVVLVLATLAILPFVQRLGRAGGSVNPIRTRVSDRARPRGGPVAAATGR